MSSTSRVSLFTCLARGVLALSVDPKAQTPEATSPETGAAATGYLPPLDANEAELLSPDETGSVQETGGVQAADDFPAEPEINGDPDDLLALIQERLEDDQAQDIVVLDLRGKSPMADYMVVASGRSQRHVGAIADHVLRALKEGGFGRAACEGLPQADWVLIDAGDIIVHLFRPEVRTFYRIEQIWSVETPGAALKFSPAPESPEPEEAAED